MAEPALSLRNLSVTLSDSFSVCVDRLTVARGEVVVLDAASGTGKSTALGLIAGAIVPDETAGQTHLIGGVSVTPDLERRAYGGPEALGFVLQTGTLIPFLSVADNITLPARAGKVQVDAEWQGFVLDMLGIAPLMDRLPAHISIGQKQRVAIARAVLTRPIVLLLDEPVSALDPENVDQVEGLIKLLAQQAGCAAVLASHQAHRGAFASARRVHHRLDHDGARTRSIFSDTAAEQAA